MTFDVEEMRIGITPRDQAINDAEDKAVRLMRVLWVVENEHVEGYRIVLPEELQPGDTLVYRTWRQMVTPSVYTKRRRGMTDEDEADFLSRVVIERTMDLYYALVFKGHDDALENNTEQELARISEALATEYGKLLLAWEFHRR